MLFSKVKPCKDDRVIRAGLDVLTDFRNDGIDVQAFGCCFVEGTFVFSFGYGIPYPKIIYGGMTVELSKRLPQEKKYKKAVYYPSDKFDEECCKKCKYLWIRLSDN